MSSLAENFIFVALFYCYELRSYQKLQAVFILDNSMENLLINLKLDRSTD